MRHTLLLLLTISVFGLQLSALPSPAAIIPLPIVADYTEAFNKYDNELYKQTITNTQPSGKLGKPLQCEL